MFFDDSCYMMANGAMMKTAVNAAVVTRPMTSAISIVFWYDHRCCLPATEPRPSLLLLAFRDSLQYRKARKYLWSQRWNGSVRDRVPRSTLSSLVLCASCRLRSSRRLACCSSSRSEKVSIVMMLLKAASASSVWAAPVSVSCQSRATSTHCTL